MAADFHYRRGEFDAAIQGYNSILKQNPNSPDAYAGLAWTAAASGDCARARRELARARELYGTTTTIAHRDPAEDTVVGAPLKRCTQ